MDTALANSKRSNQLLIVPLSLLMRTWYLPITDPLPVSVSVHSLTIGSPDTSPLTPRRHLNRQMPSGQLCRTSRRGALHLVHHMPISRQLGNRVGGFGATTTTATIQDQCEEQHDNDGKRHNNRNRGGSTTMLTGLWCRCGTRDGGCGITDSHRWVTGREVGALPYDHYGRSPDAPIRGEGGGSRCGEQLRAAPEQVEAAGACWI